MWIISSNLFSEILIFLENFTNGRSNSGVVIYKTNIYLKWIMCLFCFQLLPPQFLGRKYVTPSQSRGCQPVSGFWQKEKSPSGWGRQKACTRGKGWDPVGPMPQLGWEYVSLVPCRIITVIRMSLVITKNSINFKHLLFWVLHMYLLI